MKYKMYTANILVCTQYDVIEAGKGKNSNEWKKNTKSKTYLGEDIYYRR